ncbi:MAG TPA: hypothetical protein DCE56_15815 [Cyanobacteria bacterium UBA8553]|nr:hypothetical protein [Cyanobacteria bacterium UBA8553]HAJ58103.1 hypothetical protein [Cyanobacteria bacterium UBA8543]
MLKSLLKLAVLPVAVIPFIAESAFSLPQSKHSDYPVVPSSNTDQPICYMQTVDGKTVDLGSLCKVKYIRNSQIQQSQLIGQQCNSPLTCRDAVDPTQPLPDAAYYIPSSPPK